MKALPYKVIFFDLFHTLVDVASAPGSSGRYTADILGVSREAWNAACFGAVHNITGPSSQREVIRALAHSLDPDITIEKIDEATQERQRRFDHALLHIETEVLDVLGGLRGSGLRLGLISNASTDEVSAWTRSPLSGLIDEAVFSCHAGMCKPHPPIYLHALQRFGIDAGEALFVGDGGSDEHHGARRVGIDNVLMTRYLNDLDQGGMAKRRAAARWEISGIGELPGLLSRLRQGRNGR